MFKQTRISKHKKIRKTVQGTNNRPRLAVFRSSQHIYAQIIDDLSHKTLVAASDLNLKGCKKEKAFQVGEAIARQALDKKIKKIVFDRGGFGYHGRVASLADGARKGGLEF